MEKRPNIVLIIMESLCWERTSLAPSMPASMGKDIDVLTPEQVEYLNQ